ncbi:hypothetical protein BDV18DRAFT_132622 [Aspergillus unguis]
MTTPTGRPSRRGLGSACHLCRQRKIRCDRAKPACENCRLAAVPCVLTPLPPRPRKTVHQQLADAKAQVQHLERQLRENSSSPGLSSSAGIRLSEPGRFDTAIPTFKWHLGFCDLPSEFDLDGFFNEISEVEAFENEPVSVTARWPSHHLVQCALDYFKSTHFYSVFPAIDVDEVARLLEVSPDLSDDSLDVASRACLGAFTALVTGLRRHEPVFVAAGADPIAHVRAVLTLLPELAMQDTNIRALEALVLLAIYVTPIGEPKTGEMLLSMAVKILFNLGGNTSNPKPNNHHLRAIFWLVYGFDKENSLRRSRPPLINDADCDLDLPPTYLSEYTDYHFFGTHEPCSSSALLYPADLRMALLKSRIYRLLYSLEAQRQPDARRLQSIRELDEHLGDLRASFPRHCQPDDFAEGRVPDTLFHDLSLRGTTIHLEYYSCLTKIHAATLLGGTPPPSSVEICYQAARSTLLYIGHMQHCIIPETFWVYADPLITAVLALYRRLLIAPDEYYGREDVQILQDTARIFGRLDSERKADGVCFAPYMIAERFVSRVASLANRSIGGSGVDGT